MLIPQSRLLVSLDSLSLLVFQVSGNFLLRRTRQVDCTDLFLILLYLLWEGMPKTTSRIQEQCV